MLYREIKWRPWKGFDVLDINGYPWISMDVWDIPGDIPRNVPWYPCLRKTIDGHKIDTVIYIISILYIYIYIYICPCLSLSSSRSLI